MTGLATPLATVQSLRLTPTPAVADVALALCDRPHLLVLDSEQSLGPRSRYSIVAADPSEVYQSGYRELVAAARCREPLFHDPELPPFQTGYAGFFGYDLAEEWEPVPRARFRDPAVPDLSVGHYPLAVVFDHPRDAAWAVARPEVSRRQFRRFVATLGTPKQPQMPHATTGQPPGAPRFPVANRPGVTSTFIESEYLAALRRAIDYIHAGDCFQVNVAQQLAVPQAGHPLTLWQVLRGKSRAPFGGYCDFGTGQLVSASPERFLEVAPGRVVTTRPIKGTRPRRADPADDRREIDDLLTSEKDRAENVMIVDLLRNDIGKVASIGSVRVPRVCELESFSHVHHLVSEVTATLDARHDVWDLLKACLPGGSITGAPKIRAMQIIAELEPTARNAYCGAMGYVSSTGACDTNILIRTVVATHGVYSFSVGGGIVADSDPAREYAETFHKAAGILAALGS